MNKRRWLWLFLLLLGCDQDQPQSSDALQSVLGDGVLPGYAVVTPGKVFSFPKDHGAHPQFRSEWWYYTGHLSSQNGQLFGFQVTLFRFNIQPKPLKRVSKWFTQQIIMGHMAVTDITGQTYHHQQRLERAALGLAGTQNNPFRVWLHDWEITGDLQSPQIRVKTDQFELNLQLTASKPIILQGDHGFSRKGKQSHNASYYYSIPRLSVTGALTLKDRQHQVTGQAWLDREWSSSALEADQQGWDWFSLQFTNNQEFMYYQLRDKQGLSHPQSQGVLIDERGQPHIIQDKDITLTPMRYWISPSGRRYPIVWRIDVPILRLQLQVQASLQQQEFQGLVQYWEGAVSTNGYLAGEQVKGVGYLELTGY